MILAVRIQLTVPGNPPMSLANVRLALFDRDENDPDDFGWALQHYGEILLSFDSDHTDREDRKMAHRIAVIYTW
jgi:hypothetical protein